MPRWDKTFPSSEEGPLRTVLRWLRIGPVVLVAVGLPLLCAFGSELVVRVDTGEIAILIRKTGEDLPDGEIAAPGPGYKGIQQEVLSEGWHFRNPYTWDAVLAKQTEIPAGKVGIRLRQFGKPLRPGQVLAEAGQKGIEKEILGPGRYAVNTLLYKIELRDAFQVPFGHVGVQTLSSGKEPKNPNVFLVEPGERGTQRHVLQPGTHYLNPYEVWVDPISLQSNKIDMVDKDAIEFPSKDGFQIKMEATIEWAIDPLRAAQVFVEYVDARAFTGNVHSQDEVRKCIEEKVIVPNARAFSRLEGSKHLARDFMGETRGQFQVQFQKGMETACRGQGIQIRSAVVRKTAPPEAISSPIRERELAVQQRDKYKQQIEREKQEKQLAMEKKIQERETAVNKAQADVSVAITEATRGKEVALIDAKRKLEVARLELEAAKNQASAILARGQADAAVIRFKNAAEASGLRVARAAFGDGDAYVRFLFQQKAAPAIRSILTNTDGPFLEIFRGLAGTTPGHAAEARPRETHPLGTPTPPPTVRPEAQPAPAPAPAPSAPPEPPHPPAGEAAPDAGGKPADPKPVDPK